MIQNETTKLYWELFKVAIHTKHGLMKAAEKYGLTVMQLYTLCMLESDKSVPMHTLYSILHCDPSNVTVIVDRLFANNYIKREENPKDRREKIITLTSKGEALCKKISLEIPSYQPDYLTSLTATQRAQLLNLLTQLTSQKVPA